MFVSDAWSAPATCHRSFSEHWWVGVPNERAPCRFHGAVVGFIDRCLSRTRTLAASSEHLAEFFSGRSWPKIGPGITFFGVFEKFETFFSKICAHSERYRNILAGIFEILTFDGNIAVSYTHLRAHETRHDLVCRLLLEKKNEKSNSWADLGPRSA